MTVSLKTVEKMMRVLDALVANKNDPWALRDAKEVLREARAPYLSTEPLQRWRIRDKTAPTWFWSNEGGWVQTEEYDKFLSKPVGAKLPPDGEWEKYRIMPPQAVWEPGGHDQWR